MKKTFIDCGANKGDDIRNFVKHDNFSEIIAFECNEECIGHLKLLQAEIPFRLIEKAVSISDEGATFYVGESDISGSIVKDKKMRMHPKGLRVEVKSVDFSSWLLQNFSVDDYIVLSFDIEGAEYSILEKMFDDDSISLVNEIYLEFHLKQCKSKNITEERERLLKTRLIDKFKDKIYIHRGHQHEIFKKLNHC